MLGMRLLFQRFSGSALVYGAGAVVVLLSQLLLARLLGAEAFGAFFFALSLILVLAVPSKLGVDYSAQRFVAVYVEREEWALLRGLLRWSLRMVLGGAAVMTAVFVAVTAGLDIDAALQETLLIGAGLLPLMAFAYLRGGLLRGLHQVARGLAPDTLILPLVGLTAVFIYAVTSGVKPGAQQAMAAWLLGAIVAAVLGAIWLRGALPNQVYQAKAQYRRREWLLSSGGMLVVSGSHLLLQNIDVVLVGALVDTTQSGIYGVAARVAFVVAFPLTIANAVFAPRIAAFWSKQEHVRLQEFVMHGMRAVGLLALFAAILLSFFSEQVLRIFGEEFSVASGVLEILLVGQLVNAFAGPAAYLLAYTGHERRVAWVMGGSVLFNIGADLVLIPLYGIHGAAISAAMTVAGWNLFLYRIAYKVTRIRPSFLPVGPRCT